jgi:DDE superfamily endonuclease
MLPDATLPVPSSLMNLLAVLFPLFTAPSFRTFCGLACGFLTQTGKRTVCGMLTGAGLAQVWPHDRAHWFFSRARWNPDELGIAVAKLVVALLVPAGEPVSVAIDDTLFKRRGKKVWAASWFHDGSAAGPDKTGYGNNWVIAAIIVRLPFLDRPAAIPVLAKLVVKGTNSKSRLWLAARMAHMIADAFPGRETGVVADSAYAGAELKKLPARITWTTRLRKDAALCELPPGGPGSPVTATGTARQPHPGRRDHLPVVLSLGHAPSPGRAHPGPLHDRVRPGPGHHRPERHCGACHRALRVEVEH